MNSVLVEMLLASNDVILAFWPKRHGTGTCPRSPVRNDRDRPLNADDSRERIKGFFLSALGHRTNFSPVLGTLFVWDIFREAQPTAISVSSVVLL